MSQQKQKNRTFSLIKTLGSAAIKAGQETLKNKFNIDTSSVFESKAAERLVAGLDELKGVTMKFGQILSMMDENILPKGWKNALSKLQSEATPKDWDYIEPILLEELKNLDDFLSIETTAVHAASVGQIHKAVLQNGQKVAVKIQYPNLEKSIKSDLSNMKKIVKLLNIMPNTSNYDDLFSSVETSSVISKL